MPEEINEDASCFGEFGKRTRCDTCKFRLTCKELTENKCSKKEYNMRYKGKYIERGKYRKRDKW